MLEDNLMWKSWQTAKELTVRESFIKENSKAHWRAMIDEAKAECAWMLESHRLELQECTAKAIINRIECLEGLVASLIKEHSA